MKCPKCGYNSFEYYDACKKCFVDLSGHKTKFSLVPIILPLEARNKRAAETESGWASPVENGAATLLPENAPSLGLPEEPRLTQPQTVVNPFAFIEGAGDAAGGEGFSFSWGGESVDGDTVAPPNSGSAPPSENYQDFDALFGENAEDKQK